MAKKPTETKSKAEEPKDEAEKRRELVLRPVAKIVPKSTVIPHIKPPPAKRPDRLKPQTKLVTETSIKPPEKPKKEVISKRVLEKVKRGEIHHTKVEREYKVLNRNDLVKKDKRPKSIEEIYPPGRG